MILINNSVENNISVEKANLFQAQEIDLQKAIKTGDVSQILLSTTDLNLSLPNGELPLHFAVRQGKEEAVIQALLDRGALPFLKDYQNQTAVDHAILSNYDAIAKQLLSHQIGSTLNQATDSLHSGAAQSALAALQAKKGGLATLETKYPTQHTLLQGIVEPNLSSLNLTTNERQTLLHLAVLNNNLPLVESLLNLGIDPNVVDTDGNSAAHYAAIHSGDTRILSLLVQRGANVALPNNKGVSAVALFGAASHAQDPMKLSKTQAIMFFSTVLMHGAQIALSRDPQNAERYAGLLLSAVSVLGLSSFIYQMDSIEGTLKKVLYATLSFTGATLIPGIDVCMQAWSTYNVATTAFAGLKSCWDNIGNRTGRAVRNAVVHTVNTAQSLYQMANVAQLCYEKVLNLPYLYKIYTAQTEEEASEAWMEYETFFYERYFSGLNTGRVKVDKVVDPTPFKNMNVCKRALEKTLSEGLSQGGNPSGALAILNPEVKWADFAENGITAALKKDYKAAMLACHPDRNPQGSEATKNIGLAWAMLKKYAEENSLPSR